MTPLELQKVAAKLPLSKSVLARNTFGTPETTPEALGTTMHTGGGGAERIRQSSKPLLNKLETEWKTVLVVRYPDMKIHAQSLRVKLANGAWYKSDLAMFLPGGLTCWECKGPKVVKGQGKGLLALKVAANQYPEIKWILVFKDDNGLLQEQAVLP